MDQFLPGATPYNARHKAEGVVSFATAVTNKDSWRVGENVVHAAALQPMMHAQRCNHCENTRSYSCSIDDNMARTSNLGCLRTVLVPRHHLHDLSLQSNMTEDQMPIDAVE